MRGSKGQYFLITALLLIIYFSTLARYTYTASNSLGYRKALEYWTWRNIYEQIKTEEKSLFDYFYFNSSVDKLIKNYTLWVRNDLAVSNAELRIVFLLASKSGTTLSVKLINLAGEPITNINLTYNGTSKTTIGLDDGKEWSVSFTVQGNKLSLTYVEAGETNSYTINLGEKTGFWVQTLEASGYKIKESYSVKA